MSVYGNGVLTNLGLALYAKAQTGVTLNFTRMQIGSGSLGATDPKTLTALITPISYFSIISKTSNGNMTVVKGVFDNGGLSSSAYSCELGLFAQDPDVGEILYGYVNAGAQGDTIPAISAGPFAKQYQINAAVGNASSVTATIPAGVYIPTSDKGIANGVASLDSGGQVPASQLTNATVSAATTTTKGTVQVAAGQSSGTPIATNRMAIANDVQVTTTSAQIIAAFTPTAKGNFMIAVYYRVVTGTTNVTVSISYTDGTGAQVNTLITAQVSAIGSYSLIPLFINATNAVINVSITASVANRVFASASIMGV